MPSHPLICDIALLLRGCSSIVVKYVYREANSVADWVVSYIANHSGQVLWTHLDDAPSAFWDFVFSNFFGCIHTRTIR